MNFGEDINDTWKRLESMYGTKRVMNCETTIHRNTFGKGNLGKEISFC